jgi:hypothetical protein
LKDACAVVETFMKRDPDCIGAQNVRLNRNK